MHTAWSILFICLNDPKVPKGYVHFNDTNDSFSSIPAFAFKLCSLATDVAQGEKLVVEYHLGGSNSSPRMM